MYPLLFGFRRKFSAVHAFINPTENIRKKLEEANTPRDLQNVFDAEHYGIRGLSNE